MANPRGAREYELLCISYCVITIVLLCHHNAGWSPATFTLGVTLTFADQKKQTRCGFPCADVHMDTSVGLLELETWMAPHLRKSYRSNGSAPLGFRLSTIRPTDW